MERVILKLSGQALSDNGLGISPKKIKVVASEIKALVEEGYELGIVCGAGNMWRGRDAADNKMNRCVADNIGMLGTIMNALALEDALKQIGIKATTLSAIPMPSVTPTFTQKVAEQCFQNGEIVIFAGGTGNPYFSTDTCAALRAAQVGAKIILMAKNGTDGVYDSDPAKNSAAKRYIKLTYDEMIEKNLGVMDLTACAISKQNNIDTIVFDMNVKGNIRKIMLNKNIGTIVTVKGE